MKKAGGILAIIAGLLGLLAGFATLFLGGLGSAFSASGAEAVVSFGWGGIVFSLLVLIYGAIAFSKPRAGALGIVLSAVAGIVLGGTLVAILMALALVAGIMCSLAKSHTENEQSRSFGLFAAGAVPVICAAFFGAHLFDAGEDKRTAGVLAGSDHLVVQIGQTAHSEQFDVTVQGIRFVEQIGRGMGQLTADPGTIYAVIEVTVRCIDRESRFYHAGDLYAEIEGKSFKYDHSEVVLGLDSPSGSINPMTEKRGFVVYKIPATAANGGLAWTPGRSFNNVRVALTTNSPPVSNNPIAAPIQKITPGNYTGPSNSILQIQSLPNGQLKLVLLAISVEGNTGEAEGELAANGDALTYSNLDMDCVLTLRPSGEGIAVNQEGLCGFGINVSAEGPYRKVTAG